MIFTSYLASGIASLAPASRVVGECRDTGLHAAFNATRPPCPFLLPPHLVKCPRNCQAGEKFISNLRECLKSSRNNVEAARAMKSKGIPRA